MPQVCSMNGVDTDRQAQEKEGRLSYPGQNCFSAGTLTKLGQMECSMRVPERVADVGDVLKVMVAFPISVTLSLYSLSSDFHAWYII
jgi:hypothetical protein